MQRQYGHLFPKIVFILDFIVLNLLVALGLFVADDPIIWKNMKWILFVFNVSYLPSALYLQRFHSRRIVYFEGIVIKALFAAGTTGLLFMFLSEFLDHLRISMLLLIEFQVSFFFLLTLSWLIERKWLKHYRLKGGNFKSIVIVGTGATTMALYNTFAKDRTLGYRVLGFFAENNLEDPATLGETGCLGKISELEEYAKTHRIDEIYSTLPASRGDDILNLIHFSENNLIRYYFVPNYYNYLKRKVTFNYLGEIPVLSIRQEPLRNHWRSVFKRLFDIFFSTFVLAVIFPPLYLIIGGLIKLSSPGPVFFKQLRTGLNGKDFHCLKFRSMKVNKNSNLQQATEKDPRKTQIGEFIRRTSIDEIPQFINVLKGEMSIVGPRPHMLKHTEIYSELIDKYMLRHFVKPGITGWAQVNGCRGETKTIEEMKQRINLDISYIENWSFLLDIKIIFRTIFQIGGGDKQAY